MERTDKVTKVAAVFIFLALTIYIGVYIVNALNDKRNDLIKEKRPTDIVDEVLLKALDAPRKKVRCKDER